MPQEKPSANRIEVRIGILIGRTPADVFAFLTELNNFTKWQEGIVGAELLDPGPWRAGTRIKTIHSFLIWKHLEDYSEIVEIIPNRIIRNRGKVGKTTYREEFALEEKNGGTHLRYLAEIEPGGVFSHMKTLSAWAFRSQMRNSFNKLKQLLERLLQPSPISTGAGVI
jgi:hypothetical protein